MGELDKANYYHNRMWYGVLEDKNSAAKAMSKTNLIAKSKSIIHSFSNSLSSKQDIGMTNTGKLMLNISEDNDEIPSPRAAGKLS